MNLAKYIEAAAATAVYPMQGGVIGALYLSMKMSGEAAELLDGIYSAPTSQPEELLEAGDVLWYAGQLNRHLKFEIIDAPEDVGALAHLDRRERGAFLSIAVGKFNECFGKAIRDDGYGVSTDVLTADRSKKLYDLLCGVVLGVTLVAVANGNTLQDVADANIAKLQGRKERGTLGGDGDHR